MEAVSEYYMRLSGESKARYSAKVVALGLTSDPYALSSESWVAQPDKIPDVSWSDMFLYLIQTPSAYTKEEIQAWKAMVGGDSFMKAGWVHDLRAYVFKHQTEERILVMGKVKHSQRMSATPLLPWVGCKLSGEILAAHCTCMAGLGEACSHIAAILTSLIRAAQIQSQSGETACTSQKCSWLPMSRDVTHADVQDIDFTSPSSQKEKSNRPQKRKHRQVEPPSELEISNFYDILNSCELKPAILKITPPYSKQFIPLSTSETLPNPISQLYDPDTLQLNYVDLLAKCEEIGKSIKVTSEQSKELEKLTRAQSGCKLWHIHREGRITASNVKAVVKQIHQCLLKA